MSKPHSTVTDAVLPAEPSRRAFLAAAVSTLGMAAGGRAGFAQTAGAASAADLPASITEAGEQFRNGSRSVMELTRTYLDCIEEFEPELNAFITVMRDEALAVAEAHDAELRDGRDRGPLHGVPIVVKDLFEMAGTRTTVGSKAFEDRQTEETATVVANLIEAGAVVLGKTNMNGFAAGVSGTNPTFGDTHNPWSLEHSPGGSSSGTGAAIAAGLCLGGPGTDTGGSIRVPAAWCGITGIRPTFGLVSLYGVYPRSHSLDCAGPLARNVRDLALLLDVMAGFDPRDPNSARTQPGESYTVGLDDGVRGLRFGIVQNYTFSNIDEPVEKATREAVETLKGLGAEVKEIRVRPLEGELDYVQLFNEILLYEFNQILGERYRSTPNAAELFGPIVTNNIDTGSKVTREQYEARIEERPAIVDEVKAAFEEVDALITPALPTVAPLLAASAQDYGRGRQFTIPFSYTALPSIVVPGGFSPEGLPIGIQFVGNQFQEALLLRMGAAFTGATGFDERRPPIFCTG